MSWQRTYKATIAKKMYNSETPTQTNQKVKAEFMLAGSFMTGAGYQTVKTILNMSGRETESRSTYFRHQAESEERLIENAEKLTEKARSHFSGNVAMDCRLSSPCKKHSRRGICSRYRHIRSFRIANFNKKRQF